MDLSNQKRLAASILKCSPKRIRFDTESLEDIKEGITKSDVKGLINSGAITKLPKRGVSRVRANKRLEQKRKGRRKGKGSRKGSMFARLPRKRRWINLIRSQRKLLRKLLEKEMITKESFRDLYLKAKGGFFRSVRHLNLYIEEHGMKKK